MLKTLFLSFHFFTIPLSWGYWRAVNVSQLDESQEVRLIVAGRGDELGTLFQLAAISKAEAYLRMDPGAQIVILSAVESEKNNEQELRQFISRKFINTKKIPMSLGAREFFNEATRFKKIVSIDFYTHSTVKFGMRLDRSEDRLESIDDWSQLLPSLTDQSYLFLHGCNTGFELAPELANQLNRPVMGSLTSTYFQRLTKDQRFVNSDDKSVRDSQWISPATYRLIPDAIPYVGHWGHFSGGGLGFFKTFCGGLLADQCIFGMKKMMSFWLSAKIQFQDRVMDYLCSGRLDSDFGIKCRKALETGNFNLSSFHGNPLKCDFKSCQYELICPQFDDKCDLISPSTGLSTIHNEYRAFLSF
jgi:hypothetical protein